MAAVKSWHILRPLIVSYILSVLCLFFLTFLLYQFRLPESQITLGIYLTYALSCLAGGFVSGKTMKNRRFFWGLLTGVLYFVVLFGISCLREQAVTSELSHLLAVLGICAAGGMVGGMLS